MSETSISLFDFFSSVPDPRAASGKRHPLNAVLTLCSVAMLCGCRSLFAIAQFGRDRGQHFAASLGFTRQTTPCCNAAIPVRVPGQDRVRERDRTLDGGRGPDARLEHRQPRRQDPAWIDRRSVARRAPAGGLRPRSRHRAVSVASGRQDQRAQGRVGTAGPDPRQRQTRHRRRDVVVGM